MAEAAPLLAITAIYRLLRYAEANRVLFLVDTKNLGEQAEQEFMAYRPSDDNRKFTELYNVQRLKSCYVATDSQGTTMNILNMVIIKRLPFPLLCVEEQNNIVQRIESRLSVADKIEESINQSLNQAEALRQSILKKAFSGKLVPQDPTDEPAEKLLARIRAEMIARIPKEGIRRDVRRAK